MTPKTARSARAALKVKITRDGFGPGSKSLWFLRRPVIRCPKDLPNVKPGIYGCREANIVEPLLVHACSNAPGSASA